MKELYRYEDRLYSAGTDVDGEPIGTGIVKVNIIAFHIIKTTPKGAWIEAGRSGKKFVLLTARKRYACPTKEEAKESFLARKGRQLMILRNQARDVEIAINQMGGSIPDLTPALIF